MAKIKAVSVAVNSIDNIYIVDDKGRVWLHAKNGTWSPVELPDDPSSTNQKRIAV
jgi:hypothetical protein